CSLRPMQQNDVMIILEKAGRIPQEIEDEFPQAHYAAAISCVVPDHSPTKGEIKSCRHWIEYQIKKVKPKYVLLVGNAALLSITGSSGIKAARGRPFERDGIIYLPMYSPGILAHDPSLLPIIESDFELFR